MNHHTRSAFRWACRNILAAVLLCLNIVAHAAVLHAQDLSALSHPEIVEKMNAEFVQARKNFEAEISKARGLYNANGTINEQHPKYQEYEKTLEKIKTTYDANDMRYNDFVDACKKAGVGENLKNTGGKPTSRLSDLDFTELKPGDAQKVVDYMNSKGIHVKGRPDRFVIPGTDNTIWKHQPKLDPGSAAHRAQCQMNAAADDIFSTAGGVEVTSKGTMGVKDPVGYPIANAKKFNDAVQMGDKTLRPDLPEAVQKIDSRTAGKSVSKVIEGGFVNADPVFAKQAKLLRGLPPATAWESAGIVRFNDTPQVKADKIRQWLAKGGRYLGEAVVSGQVQSVEVATKRSEMVKRLQKDGLANAAKDVIRQQLHANVSNEETIFSIGRKNPKLAGEMCGMKLNANPDGSFTNKVTGKKMAPSEVQQAIKSAAQKMSRESMEAARRSQPKATSPAKSPASTKPLTPTSPRTSPPPPGSRITNVGGRLILLETIYQGAMQGAKKAVDEEKPGDWTNTKATIYGIGYATGIPGLVDMAANAGTESSNQFDQDVKDGKNPSETWALARAAFTPAVSLVKGMTIDPVINAGEAVWEGAGWAKDTVSSAWAESQSQKSLQNVRDLKEERARKTEGVEARTQRLILAENVFRTRGIPVVYGSKVPNPAQDNDRLKQDNPDDYNHRLALILTEFDRLADKLKRDGVLNSEKNRARDEIYKLLQQKYTNTPKEFQKALKLQYANYKKDYDKLYSPAPTPQELAGKWNSGRVTVRAANFAANSGCTPEMQEQLGILRGREMPLGLDVETDAKGNGSLMLGFTLPGGEQPMSQRVPFQFKDGKIQGEVAQAGGSVFKVNGELVRTDSGWALNGSWQMSGAVEGKTVMLIKGDLSASK